MGEAFMAMHPPPSLSKPCICCPAGKNGDWGGDGDLHPSPSSGAPFAICSLCPVVFTLSPKLILFFIKTPVLSSTPNAQISALCRAGCVNIPGFKGKLRSYKDTSISLHNSSPRNNSSVLGRGPLLSSVQGLFKAFFKILE